MALVLKSLQSGAELPIATNQKYTQDRQTLTVWKSSHFAALLQTSEQNFTAPFSHATICVQFGLSSLYC